MKICKKYQLHLAWHVTTSNLLRFANYLRLMCWPMNGTWHQCESFCKIKCKLNSSYLLHEPGEKMLLASIMFSKTASSGSGKYLLSQQSQTNVISQKQYKVQAVRIKFRFRKLRRSFRLSFKMEIFHIKLLMFFIICLTVPHNGLSMYFEEVANLTPSQRNTLNEFRRQVQHLLPHSYMKEDLYLLRFLRMKDFRLRDSVKAIKEAMEWRALSSMDSIDGENFADLEDDFPLYFDGVDKQGRVIMEANFGAWPLRTAVLAGKLPRLKRYGVKAIEDATKKIRRMQEYQGQNVTQWVMLLNMDGFSVQQNACPACLPYYLNFVSSYEKYYPFSVGHMVYVNTPEAFEIVLNLVRPLMNVQTRKVMKIFGTDERKWRSYVQKHFEDNQIGDWFGGLKHRKSR